MTPRKHARQYRATCFRGDAARTKGVWAIRESMAPGKSQKLCRTTRALPWAQDSQSFGLRMHNNSRRPTNNQRADGIGAQ
jgi:hypothetical protein